jgi:lysophospholipase L1-like esterase
MNQQELSLVGGPVEVVGAVSVDANDKFVMPWRLPFDEQDLFYDTLVERASMPAGVRLVFVSDTTQIELDVELPEAQAPYDLLVDAALHQRVDVSKTDGTVRFGDLPAGEHRLEIYLPLGMPARINALRIDAGASVKPWHDDRPRWITYGSSITHARQAAGPSEAWPAMVANRFGLNLTCLGYGGNCHLEPMVARMIRDLPADYISLCLGINVQGKGSLNERTFRSAVIGLIAIIRERHARTPMAVVSPICSPPRETEPGACGLSLADMRREIVEAVDRLRRHGDEHLHYISGLDLFGPDFVHHMPDQLHPDAQGQHALADQYAKTVMPAFGLRPV